MTAIAVRDQNDYIETRQTSLTVWAGEAREAAQVAVSLAKTPFVPQSLRDRDPGVTAANITAAILTGQELGLEPMAALRSIDVIQGTPALRAVALRAVVQAAGHELWLAESTATRAIVRGRRRGSDQTQESVWTLDRAKALGLAGKDNWRKQPGAMLIARATAECARLIAADALLGVPYTAEEIDDGVLDTAPLPVAAGSETVRRTAQRRTAQRASVRVVPDKQDPEPPSDPEPDLEPAAETDEWTPEPITKAQQTKLHALFGDLEITDRDARLATASEFVERDLASSSELTKEEASRLIDALERRATSKPNGEPEPELWPDVAAPGGE